MARVILENLTKTYPEKTGPGVTAVKGIGLGLNYVAAVVQRHGGAIAAHNAADGGAAFELTLPLDDPD